MSGKGQLIWARGALLISEQCPAACYGAVEPDARCLVAQGLGGLGRLDALGLLGGLGRLGGP